MLDIPQIFLRLEIIRLLHLFSYFLISNFNTRQASIYAPQSGVSVPNLKT